MSRRHYIGGVVLVAILVLGALAYKFYFSWQFSHVYETYSTLSRTHVSAAFLPATNDNPLRQELNRTLATVLAEDMPSTERLKRAERGLTLLNDLEKQIDAIGEAGEAVSQSIHEMEARASGTERQEIVSLALERVRIIGDIRGLSYRAGYHTAEIFNRVIADGGALTKEHITDLNNQIPLVEEQFDRRAGLYSELESISSKISQSVERLPLF